MTETAPKCPACAFAEGYLSSAGAVGIDLLVGTSAGVAVGLAFGLELARRTEGTRQAMLNAICPHHREVLDEVRSTLAADGDA